MSHESHERFRALVETALAGTISVAEHEELESLLRESAEMRQTYLELTGLHLDLAQVAHEFPGSDPQTGNLRISSRQAGGSRTRAPRVSLFAMAAVATSAAAVLVVAVLSQSPTRPGATTDAVSATGKATAPEPAALQLPVVVEAARARFFGLGFALKPGELLEFDKEYVLTQGYVAIEFSSGARAVLKAPSVFSPTGPATLLVRSGQCSVHAPPGAEGFCVHTPSADVIDLGTRFVIDVAATGETDLLVVDGAASLAGTNAVGRDPLLLKEGDAAHVEPGENPQKQSPSASDMRFIERLPDRVIKYDATQNDDHYADELLAVTVQRGGRVYEYPRDRLTRSRLVQFAGKPNAAVFCTRQGESLPAGAARLALLDEDWSLVTGVINPQMIAGENGLNMTDPVMVVEFAEPVVNGPGPDILLFDLQLLIYREQGDIVRVMSGDESHRGRMLEIDHFDVDLTSPYALNLLRHKTYRARTAPLSLEQLIDVEVETGKQNHVDAKGLVTGIDLSQLGYKPGEALSRLMILESGTPSVDPVLIVGLPEVPEP